MRDVYVRMTDDCDNDMGSNLSFKEQRRIAEEELSKRDQPLYDASAYLFFIDND